MPALNSPSSAPSSAPSSGPLQPPAQSDPLAGLRDIHTPADISGFPIAPGWWILAALILTVLVVGWTLLRRKRQQGQYRREALTLLEQTMSKDASTLTDSQRLQDINSLLKRVALVAYPNTVVARFHGREWSQFLQRSAPALQQPTELSEILSAGLYAAPSQQSEQVTVLQRYAKSWIKQHEKESKLPVPTEATHAAS